MGGGGVGAPLESHDTWKMNEVSDQFLKNWDVYAVKKPCLKERFGTSEKRMPFPQHGIFQVHATPLIVTSRMTLHFWATGDPSCIKPSLAIGILGGETH